MRSEEFVGSMRIEMDRIVTDYGTIPRIPRAIDGTAAFPGGTGLWRGFEPRGALPLDVPESPIFVVAHNFDSVRSYEKSIVRGSEKLDSNFWAFLLLYLAGAKIDPSECFITNALMGLQPGRAQGALRGGGPRFEQQCLEFLDYEFSVTQPAIVIALGGVTTAFVRRLSSTVPLVSVRHPSSYNYVANVAKQADLDAQVRTIAASVGRGTATVPIPLRYRRTGGASQAGDA